MKENKIKEVSLLKLKPYFNNPRLNAKSVQMLEQAIARYGFLVPITVDEDYVIITGHSRFTAAKKLGLAKVPIIVLKDLSEREVKEYRIADNKVGEFSKLDVEAKYKSLAEYVKDDVLMAYAFPEVEVEAPTNFVTPVDLNEVEEEPESTECICPYCYHEFEV
jgi:ParB family transcriptional regulator, chromosome partitioning protein